MTVDKLVEAVTESGLCAMRKADKGNDEQAAQWMQVKMLAEIALQLRLMNDGNGARQPNNGD